MKPLWIWAGGRIQCGIFRAGDDGGIFRVGDDGGISIRVGLLIQNSRRAGVEESCCLCQIRCVTPLIFLGFLLVSHYKARLILKPQPSRMPKLLQKEDTV